MPFRYSKKMPTSFFNNDPMSSPSCNDLGGCDCEGWLWLKEEKFVRRWCVLKHNVLRISEDPKIEEVEVEIQMVNKTIKQCKKPNSHNAYFKITGKEATFMFGTESKSDLQKWLNKLNLTAANIQLDEKDGPVGGFTSGYILTPTSSLKANEHICKHEESNDCINDEKGKRNSKIAEFPKFPDEFDSRIEIAYVKFDEENYNSILSAPKVPPRKKSLNSNFKLEKKSVKENSFENLDNNDRRFENHDSVNTNINPYENDSIKIQTSPSSPFHLKNDNIKNHEIVKNPNIIENESKHNVFKSNIDIENGNEKKSSDLYPNVPITREISVEDASDFKMKSIKRIAELERLIREKKTMLAKLNQVLKSKDLPNTILEFWDENGEEILKFVSKP